MKFFLTTFTFLILLLFFGIKPIHANLEDFDISAKTVYRISENGNARVLKEVTIVNKREFIIAPSYSISFGFEDIKNIQIYNSFGSIPFDYEKKDGMVNLNINFTDPPKGLNAQNSFNISFETNEVVDRKGEIYEIDIPGIADSESFTNYDTQIIVPSTFPEPSILKPNLPDKMTDLSFSKDETGGAGIVLIFGDAQYFKLNLTYNISNPNIFPITTEIALPPNTNYQQSLISSLSIQPSNVEVDMDGNWLASYNLMPRERKTIEATVLVKLFATPQKSMLTDREKIIYTSANKFWESNNPEVENIAKDFTSANEIYEYVVDYLTYDFEKISSNNERLGGRGALENPLSAVCLEFADLFVTLARAAGIPARTVEGYAYTRNSKLRPLSLMDDVLHAWAQYYDFEKEMWVMVDPTWGNTTRGIDYFNSLDLDHITFVIKGEESIYPIPAGGYKTEETSRDIDISFTNENEFVEIENIAIEEAFPKFSLSGLPINGFITLKNKGNKFIEERKVIITNLNTGQEKEYIVTNLPPFGEETFRVQLDTPFLTNSKHNIKIQSGDVQKITQTSVSMLPDINLVLIGGGIFVSTGIVTWFAYKTWRVYIQRRKR